MKKKCGKKREKKQFWKPSGSPGKCWWLAGRQERTAWRQNMIRQNAWYKCRNPRQWQQGIMGRRLQASYTVEAAGVMAVVLFTMMVLFHQAFYMEGWTAGTFQVHEQVERERHEMANIDEKDITQEALGQGWTAQIAAKVFRPEESLRMWSVLEEKGED